MKKYHCFACNPSNPDRIVSMTDQQWTFNFNKRFEGLSNWVHGGIALGALICPALQQARRNGITHPAALRVTGRFNLPVPISQPIPVSVQTEQEQYRLQLHGESNVLVEASVEVTDIENVIGSTLQGVPQEHIRTIERFVELADANLTSAPTLSERSRAGLKAIGRVKGPATCFGCSGKGGALKLPLRPTPDGYAWGRWRTEPNFTVNGERLAETMVVAALDCACILAIMAHDPEFVKELRKNGKNILTGTYGVRFLQVPSVGVKGDYRVLARYLNRDGRKLFTLSALLDQKGALYAIGEQTAIIYDFPAQKINPL